MNSDGPTLLLRAQPTRHTMQDMHEDFHNFYVKSQGWSETSLAEIIVYSCR